MEKEIAWPDPPYKSTYVQALVESLRLKPDRLPGEVVLPLHAIVTDSGLDGPGAETRISQLAEDLADADETLLSLWYEAQQASPGQYRGGWEAVEVVAAASTVGPLVTAFCAELGRRLGGTASDWAARVRLGRRPGDSTGTDLVVEADSAVTVLELDENLSDEARLSLLDLDLKAQAIRGHRLKWNAETNAWMPIDAKRLPSVHRRNRNWPGRITVKGALGAGTVPVLPHKLVADTSKDHGMCP